jgi:DNA-binding transcriptional ArsR family regulator
VDPNRASDGWSALADGTRRAIVSRLADGPQAVGQLAAEQPVSRPAVSQHLKVLKDAGLVSERAVGTRRVSWDIGPQWQVETDPEPLYPARYAALIEGR